MKRQTEGGKRARREDDASPGIETAAKMASYMCEDVTFGKRILVIDDDPSARESIKLLLTIDRHAVTEAQDGIEGLALVAQQTFDLVLLDFFMPRMHGGEVARRIKQIAPSLPILMVTAYVEKLIGSERTINMLGKPFGVDDLRCKVTEVLRSSEVN